MPRWSPAYARLPPWTQGAAQRVHSIASALRGGRSIPGDPASRSRRQAQQRRVRPPDPQVTPETVRHGRPAQHAHVRVVRALPSTSWGGEHLRPRRRSSAPRVHARLHRATLQRDRGPQPTGRPDCPWHTARHISAHDRPGRWHNQRAIIGNPQEGPCAGLLRLGSNPDAPEASVAQPADVPCNSLDGPLYEFACNEGNNSIPLILSETCAHERAEEAASR